MNQNGLDIAGNVVDVLAGRIYYARLGVRNGRIQEFSDIGDERRGEAYLLPGFIDAHVHIESSMLVPTEFAGLPSYMERSPRFRTLTKSPTFWAATAYGTWSRTRPDRL